jgi:hypothetical protein
VTITGTGFESSTPAAVYFGPTPAASVAVLSATTIRAESPAGTGAVDVTVITVGGASGTSPADRFTYAMDGPQVTSVQRYGFHAQPTYVVVDFSGPLDQAPAQNVANYQIVGPGHHRIKIKQATYNSTMGTVTLMLSQRLHLRTSYRLKINGTTSSGLTDPAGMLLDGASTGQPGSDYVASLMESDLAGSAKQRPMSAVFKARAESVIVGLRKTSRTTERSSGVRRV